VSGAGAEVTVERLGALVAERVRKRTDIGQASDRLVLRPRGSELSTQRLRALPMGSIASGGWLTVRCRLSVRPVTGEMPRSGDPKCGEQSLLSTAAGANTAPGRVTARAKGPGRGRATGPGTGPGTGPATGPATGPEEGPGWVRVRVRAKAQDWVKD
jgi:hypothetical protein